MMMQIQSHILFSKVNEQIVILDTQKNEYYVINEMGRIFLEKIREERTLEEVSREIAEDYDITMECLKADLMEFIQLLSAEGFIEG